MKLEFNDNTLTVIKEQGDPYPKASNWCPDAESVLLYHVKNILNKDYGFNLIKIRMWKDGHMVDNLQHYLRPAKRNKDNSKNIFIYNPSWNICGAEEDFNKHGKTEFTIVRDIFE
jgi:hypothetical protein